ncbi:MAG: rod shape-determining protein RodA [Flavobacteriales bacterium]
MTGTSIFKQIDWLIVILYVVLCLMGLLNIYSAGFNEDFTSIFDQTQKHGKQLFFILSSLFLGIVILFTSDKLYTRFSWVFYATSVLLLFLVLIFGKEIGGARAWFRIGSLGLQPTEFAKFSTLLLIASFLSIPMIDIGKFKNQLIVVGILALPLLFIMLQPDPGSAIIYSSLIFALYREGLPRWYIWIIYAAIIIFFSVLLFPITRVIFILVLLVIGYSALLKPKKRVIQLPYIIISATMSVLYAFSVTYIYNNVFKQHHRNRIDIALGKLQDKSGVEYNVLQSKIAIGSGGFNGKGFLEGTQTKFKFVPEQITDFIFSTIGEEWGAVGTSTVLFLFLLLICRIVIKAEKQRSTFTRVYGYGVAGILFLHVFVNIGMAIGLLPVIGIPLPFFSYGGSSLWGFSILLFIFIRLDAQRKEIL